MQFEFTPNMNCSVKEEHENNDYVDDKVFVTETTCDMGNTELKDYIKCEPSSGKLMETGLSTSAGHSNRNDANVKIEDVGAVHDIKIEYDNGLLQSTCYYSIKEEHENNDYVDDKVVVTETTCDMGNTEFKDYIKCEPSSGKLMETGLSTSKGHSNRSDENVKIEDVGAVRDIKIENDNSLLLCVHCQAYYEDYCITCGMLVHVLNETLPSNTDSTSRELPKGILEIVDVFGRFQVYASKVIPQGVKFGPFTGLGTSGCTWKLKGGKFVVSEDKSKLLNWMQHVNPARNIDEQNLLPFRCEKNVYYRSTRQIQNGEELLVYFGRECEHNLNNDVEIDFTPRTEDGTEDVFACTFCCLGFSSKEYLVQHKSICKNKTNASFSIKELTQCPLCKIYLGEMEYSKCHMTYCRDRNARNCTSLALENKVVKGNKYKARRRLTMYKGDLKNHTNKHFEEKIPKWGACCQRFKTKGSLKAHVERKHIHVGEREARKRSKSDHTNANAKVKRSEIHLNPQDDGKQFQCEICEFRTKTKLCMKRHVKGKHLKEFSHKCEICDYKTNMKSHLETHINTKHLKEFSHECEICVYKTNLKSNLERHIKTKHLKEFSHECEICDYKANLKLHLERHIKTKHLKEFSHKCEMCDFKTNVKSYFEVHRKTKHLKEFSHECEICDFKTNTKSLLKLHVKTKHLKEFSHKCEICNYKTNVKSYFEMHIKTQHLKEFSHECKICDYKANLKSKLERHMKTQHLKEFSHECEMCDYKTNLKSNLGRHKKTKHLKEFSHECKICNYKANLKSNLEKHMITKHLKEFHECEICDYKTNRKSCLKIHIKTKHLKEFSHECKMCDYKTNLKPNLERHMETKHLKEFSHECEICDYKANQKSSLERHVKRKHLKEFNLECAICDYKTNVNSYLEIHIKTKHHQS